MTCKVRSQLTKCLVRFRRQPSAESISLDEYCDVSETKELAIWNWCFVMNTNATTKRLGISPKPQCVSLTMRLIHINQRGLIIRYHQQSVY